MRGAKFNARAAARYLVFAHSTVTRLRGLRLALHEIGTRRR
jgi:hypothetical protein